MNGTLGCFRGSIHKMANSRYFRHYGLDSTLTVKRLQDRSVAFLGCLPIPGARKNFRGTVRRLLVSWHSWPVAAAGRTASTGCSCSHRSVNDNQPNPLMQLSFSELESKEITG